MAADISSLVQKALAALKGDKSLLANFNADPVKAIEGIIGKDLPDETVKKVIDEVKKALADKGVKGILAKIKALFCKK